MTSRRLLVLGIVALLAIGAGIWLAGRHAGSLDAYGALYPDLAGQLDEVTAVRIFKPGEERGVEIIRTATPGQDPQDDSATPSSDSTNATTGRSFWGVSERANYPADETKLRKLLRALADAKIYEEKTSRAEQYAELGVEDLSTANASGVRLELAGTASPVNLIIGKRGLGAQSRYVRRAGEPKSWLVNASLDASTSPESWLRKDILDISADRIQSAVIDIAKAKAYTASKGSRADADFKVEGLPKGKKLSSASAANTLASALSGLTLTDVQKADAFAAKDAIAHATYKTFDGLVVEIDGWQRDDKHYIALRTAFDPAQAERFKIATAAAQEPADAGDASTADRAQDESAPVTISADAAARPQTPDVEAEARDAQARLSGWIYEVPSYKYDSIFKPVDQLL